MEAWRRALTDTVSAFPIAKAGPAHIATLKTFDPPLSALEGRQLAGADRSGKRLRFPTTDGELLVLVHLMTAGRLKYLKAGEAGPKTPAFQVVFEGGARLVLTEAGAKKRAGVWLLTPEEAAHELAHLGPEALGLGVERLAEICGYESRRLHSLLRDQRVIAGIGRAWANEILHHAQLSPYELTRDVTPEQVEQLANAIVSGSCSTRIPLARTRSGTTAFIPLGSRVSLGTSRRRGSCSTEAPTSTRCRRTSTCRQRQFTQRPPRKGRARRRATSW